MSADVKTFSLIFSLVIFTLTQECNFEVPRLNQNGWRCTDFRLDFLIDIVKKFVISLTSARSYSKASRCVKGFFFTCDGRRGWLPRPPMLLLRELDKTDFWNIFYLFWENLLHSFYRHPIRKYSVGEKDSKHLFTSILLRRWENIFKSHSCQLF